MSTVNETKNILNGNKRSIRDIPATIKSGTRMTREQLRFCIIAACIIIAALVVLMVIAGNRAEYSVAVNEEAALLQDASGAERILSVDGKKIAFQDGYSYSGNGKRLILNEKITTSKNYWVTMATEDEIAEYEQVIGEGRFIQLEKTGNNSLWIMMGTEDEMKKINQPSSIVLLNEIQDDSWLQKGTDEDKKAAEEAFNNITFIQFEKLGNTHIRLRRGTESEIQKLDNGNIGTRGLRLIAILLLILAGVLLLYAAIQARTKSFGMVGRNYAAGVRSEEELELGLERLLDFHSLRDIDKASEIIADAVKADRKILLRNLPGSSAFRTGKKV